MISQIELGNATFSSNKRLKILINEGEITLGGNKPLKIYGTLQCKSGKRLKVANRIFFESEEEAIGFGYRPCGCCMKDKYKM